MKEIELAYAAGIVDGEGSISIFLCNSNKRKEQYYSLQFAVVNTNHKIIKWFKDNFGGSTRLKGCSDSPECMMWRITGKKASNILEQLIPYLHIKQDQAKLAISFASTLNPLGRNRNNVCTPRTLEIREEMYKMSKQLNARRGDY